MKQVEKLKEVLESAHVAEVEVSLEEEDLHARYYSAVTFYQNGLQKHIYSVRLGEDSDGVRWGKCNCAAGAVDVLCRHLIAAAQKDTEIFGKSEIYAPTVAKYKAHKQKENISDAPYLKPSKEPVRVETYGSVRLPVYN